MVMNSLVSGRPLIMPGALESIKSNALNDLILRRLMESLKGGR